MPPPPRLRLNKSRLLLCPSSNNKTHSSARMTGADCYVPAPGVHPISASSLTGLGFPTVTNTTNVDFGSKDDADGRDAPPTVGSKVAYAPASQSIHLREQHTCRGGITPTANGSLPSLNPFSWDCVPARHASLIGDEVPHPSCALGMSMPLDAFPGDAEYYSATSDDDCNSNSEGGSGPFHIHPDNADGAQANRGDDAMDTHICGALPSRPAWRLSNTSSEESVEEQRWINSHFELVTPATSPLPSHPYTYCSYSHHRDAAEGDSSALDPLPFPDVRFVSLPAQSQLSRSSSSPSLLLSTPPCADELAYISSSYSDSRPATPTSSYSVDVEREMTSPFHMPVSPVARPSSPLRFAPRPATLSNNSLPAPEHAALSAHVASPPREGQGRRLRESRQAERDVEDAPDVSIAIDFVAENGQTGTPTFTSRITTLDHIRHSVSVRTDARVALDKLSTSPLPHPENNPSNGVPPSPRIVAGKATLPTTTSLSRKFGSFVARRLSVNRGRRHSASTCSAALPRPAPLSHTVSSSSLSYKLANPRLPIDHANPTSPSSDASSNARRARYTLVLEVDVDVGGAATPATTRSPTLTTPNSPSPQTGFQAPFIPSPNNRAPSFDIERAPPSLHSHSSHSPRVSFSPMPSSPLASYRPAFAAEQQATRSFHEPRLSHHSDGRRTLSPLPSSRPMSASDHSEPTMTVTIERDDAGPFTRLMRRVSIGRGRRRSATTSFVLASTRVLPVPEHTVDHAATDGQSAPEMIPRELDGNQVEMAPLTLTSEQMRRWST